MGLDDGHGAWILGSNGKDIVVEPGRSLAVAGAQAARPERGQKKARRSGPFDDADID
jgi:hypothetical protein